jgi:hypothetical protein
MTDLKDLDFHPFAQNVVEKGAAINKLLGDRALVNVVPDYTREPDEHEFFLIGVAISMAEVLNCCHQLNQIPILLANHHQTPTMDKAGINRHSLIVYHLENYLIRTQSLLDRVLKLVDAVFHLLNDARNCRYEVVARNVKVQVSDVLEPIKKLRKLLDRYSGVRNEIVHHHSIKEDALRRLDMFFLIERWEQIAPKEKPSDIGELVKDTIFEILWFKKRELLAFNKEIAASITVIFDKLAPYYKREERTLRLRLAKPDK